MNNQLLFLPAMVAAFAICIRVFIAYLDFKKRHERNSSTLFFHYKNDIDRMFANSKAHAKNIQLAFDLIIEDPLYLQLPMNHQVALASRLQKYAICAMNNKDLNIVR